MNAEGSDSQRRNHDRWAGTCWAGTLERGSHPVRADGLLRARLRAQGHRRAGRVPHHAAAGRAAGGGGGGGRRRVVHRDLDGRLDRPAHRLRPLPGQVLPGRPGAGTRGRVHRLHRLRHRPVRGRLDPEPHLIDHRQRLRLQGAQGAAAGGHADPAALHQDLSGTAARHRDGARVPEQVRAAAARRDHQAQAGPVRAQLRAGRVRGAAGRSRLHQGRREHQLAAVHALAGPLPVHDGGRQPRPGADRRDQGALPQRHRGHHGGHVRAGRLRPGSRQRHRHDRPDGRVHGDALHVQVGPQERRRSCTCTGPVTAPTRARSRTASASGSSRSGAA